ncbi:MAG: hypothetical protein WDW36_000278 [Sanguina aurantia]
MQQVQVFSLLAVVSSISELEELPWFKRTPPFRTTDTYCEPPHPGLRSYPFLGQVSRKWRTLLSTPQAQALLWRSLTVDFGHEVVTAIHTPLKWSNQRPSSAEFETTLAATSLSASKIVTFMQQRCTAITALSLCNSEGCWGEEGEYLNLTQKHNFTPSHLGFTLGILRASLQELQIVNCNDLLNADVGLWSIVSLLPQLRVLVTEGVSCRLPAAAVTDIGCLTQLERLCITGEEHNLAWIVGIDTIPPSWRQLTSLQTLELRGHQLLDALPPWLGSLPSLTKLDISSNSKLSIENIGMMTGLRTLVLQKLGLGQDPGPGGTVSASAKRLLPSLEPLAKNLTALSLGLNSLTRIPESVTKCVNLVTLDLNGNKEITISAPLAWVSNMPRLAVVDLTGVHTFGLEKKLWNESKCETMCHVTTLAKALKRRPYPSKVIFDIE